MSLKRKYSEITRTDDSMDFESDNKRLAVEESSNDDSWTHDSQEEMAAELDSIYWLLSQFEQRLLVLEKKSKMDTLPPQYNCHMVLE